MSARLTDEQLSNIEKNAKDAERFSPHVTRNTLIKLISNLRHYKQLAEERGAALEFYASEETYDIEHLNRHGYIIIDKDGGERAREALGKGQQP